MKLEMLNLSVEKCGPLRDVFIDFSNGQGRARNVTLLAGANGSGKTTVLELIAGFFSTLIRQARGVPGALTARERSE